MPCRYPDGFPEDASPGRTRPAFQDPLLTAHVIPPDADLDFQDAQIGRAVRAFLASGAAEGLLDTSIEVGAPAERCVAALEALLAARDVAERGLSEMRERLDLAMHNTEGGVWDWDLLRRSLVIDSAWRSLRARSSPTPSLPPTIG